MNNVVKFKGAQLPTQGMTSAFLRAKDVVGVTGNTAFLRLTKGTGEWVYGQTNTEVEENSLWAINPGSFSTGYIAWKGGKPVGKRMKPINDPNPVTLDELPACGAEWDVNVAFELQCVYGEDATLPVVVEYTANSFGGKKAFSALMSSMHRQSIEDPAHIVPVVELLNDSYQHPEWGQIYNPIFQIRKWVAYDSGQAAQPEASPQEPEPTARKAPPSQPPRDAAASEAAPTRRRAAAPVTDVEDEPVEAAKAAPEQSEPVTRRRRRAAAPA
jgi:hypothetical protein